MYKDLAFYFKYLGDENRIKIIDMLTCDCLSNKDMLKYLEITQPTLSHHLKILEEAGIVKKNKKKNLAIYELNIDKLNEVSENFQKLCTCKETCSCFEEDYA